MLADASAERSLVGIPVAGAAGSAGGGEHNVVAIVSATIELRFAKVICIWEQFYMLVHVECDQNDLSCASLNPHIESISSEAQAPKHRFGGRAEPTLFLNASAACFLDEATKVHLAFCLVITDAAYGYVHWQMHRHRSLWKHIHSIHHEYKETFVTVPGQEMVRLFTACRHMHVKHAD